VRDAEHRDGLTGIYARLDRWDGSKWGRIAYLQMDHEATVLADLAPGAGFVMDDLGIPFAQPIRFVLPRRLRNGGYRLSIDGSLPPDPPSDERAGPTKVHLERLVFVGP
jgi:hypothetical protein